jgi:hypothetical protein
MLLPESFVLQLGLYRISTGAYLPPVGLTVHKPTPRGSHAVLHPNPEFVMKAGLHSVDQVSDSFLRLAPPVRLTSPHPHRC